MNPARWVEHQTKQNPFLSVLVVILIIIVPGYFRVERAVDNSNDATITLAEQTEKQRIETCQTRNTFQKNTREKFSKYNDTIELALIGDISSPELVKRAQIFMENLRASVETTPQEEDQDCNVDGYFDEFDYLP